MISDEFGDYAGDDQDIIRMMMQTCFNCADEWTEPCEERGHERLLTEQDLKWAVCGTCHGSGTSSLYLGSFTGEQLWEDPEFADDYLSGRYDRPCPECGGRTTVREISENAEHRDQIDEWFKDMYEMRAIEAAERRAGA